MQQQGPQVGSPKHQSKCSVGGVHACIPLFSGALSKLNCFVDCQVLRDAVDENARHRDLRHGRPGITEGVGGEGCKPTLLRALVATMDCICSRVTEQQLVRLYVRRSGDTRYEDNTGRPSVRCCNCSMWLYVWSDNCKSNSQPCRNATVQDRRTTTNNQINRVYITPLDLDFAPIR